MCRKKKTGTLFQHKVVDSNILRDYPKFDINAMYERTVDELTLQQSKRDQLLTIYLAAFAFIVPALLTSENVNWIVNGAIFVGLGVIGYLFALIIIRYRKYKEAYWICCRTLNVMMTVDETNWTKTNIQAIYYNCLMKKIKKFIDSGKFKTMQFIWKNLFSGETLYLVIHSIIAGSVFGLGIGMLLPLCQALRLIIGIASGLLLVLVAVGVYFDTLIKVYSVCVDGLEESFNRTFGDAWFLHFYVDKEQDDEKNNCEKKAP